MTAVPGESRDTLHFPLASVYDLDLTTPEADSFDFIWFFTAPSQPGVFDPSVFDLVGDQMHGGLPLAP